MKKLKKTYLTALREEAVELVLAQGLSIEQAAASVSIPKGTLADWVAAARRGPSESAPPAAAPGPNWSGKRAATRGTGRNEDGARYRKKRGGGVLCAGVAAGYAWMKTARLKFSVMMLCKALGVSRSGFYDWLYAEPSARAQEYARLKVLITAAHRQSREIYGTRRVKHELAAQGYDVGRDRGGRLRKEL